MLGEMSFPAPLVPVFPPAHAAITSSTLRYEDCTQDGRLIPIAIPATLGGLWRDAVARHPGARHAIATGTIPILTRITIDALDQPIRVDRSIETRGGFQLAHDLDERGEVARLFMCVWSEVHGIAGRVGPRQPEGALSVAGRLFAEHTFTRLFAPPGQRKVTRLDAPGYPEVPEARYPAARPDTAQEAPEGARWLDELAPDEAPVVFTLDQTDANQHVNSLVYVRVFLDAVQRRLALAGQPLVVMSRAIDIAYRKPCFAGDRVRVHLRLFADPGHPRTIGAAGHIVGDDGKPRCYVRVRVGP